MRCRDRPGAAAAVLLLSLLAGCSGGLASPVPPARGDLVLAIERGGGVPPGSLYLKPVPGGLLGQTADRELARSAPGASGLRIPVAELTARLDPYAAQARHDDFNPGELARPRELGIARVGTFYEAAQSGGCKGFRSGLDLPADALLVYVDRPGAVRGTRYAAPYIMVYQLEFPAAGLYAVAASTRGQVVTQQVVTLPERIRVSVRAACD